MPHLQRWAHANEFLHLRVSHLTWWNCSHTIIPSPCLCWVNQLLLCLPAHLLLTFKSVSSSRTSTGRELLNGVFSDQAKRWHSRSSCPLDPSFCWRVHISSKAQSSFTMVTVLYLNKRGFSRFENLNFLNSRFGIFALLQLLMCSTDHMAGTRLYILTPRVHNSSRE